MSCSLLNLLQLTDPTLPIGSFSHSAGLETYVQLGIVHDAASAKTFISEMLSQNLQYNDAAFAALAFDALKEENFPAIISLDELCNAVKLPRELREASHKLGMRLVKIYTDNYRHPFLIQYKNAVMEKKAYGHYAVAFGMIAAFQDVEKKDMLTGYFYNAAIGMMTNCVKLIPLGQQDGQRLIVEIKPLIGTLVEQASHLDPELLGLCSSGFDIRSMQHEALYSRLYMS